jgi:hypothetical protein
MIYRSNKYHSKKITINGIQFDSRKEAKRFAELAQLEKAGHIANLQRQVKFVLIPAQREPDAVGKRGGIIKGKLLEREVAYYADFVYMRDGVQVVEDTKGIKTKDYIIKRKLMLYIHGIRVREI